MAQEVGSLFADMSADALWVLGFCHSYSFNTGFGIALHGELKAAHFAFQSVEAEKNRRG
jgi:hypothetical protein